MDAFDIELDNLDYFYMPLAPPQLTVPIPLRKQHQHHQQKQQQHIPVLTTLTNDDNTNLQKLLTPSRRFLFSQQQDNLPDTNLSPPTVKRMIPLPVIGVEDSDPILTPGNRDSMASDEGVVNPAFDSLDRLGVGGPAWSETSSDNNNRDDPSANRKRESYGVTDSLPRFIAPDLEREGKTSTLKSWDVFRVVNRSKQRGVDDELLSKVQKGLKIILSVFLTMFILVFTIVAKSTLFLITSNVYSNVTFECEWISGTEVTSCRRVPADRVTRDAFHPAPSVQAHWLWALFIVVCSPNVFTFGKCLWRLLAIETLHTAGITLFTFYVLPSMDALRGLALTFGVGCVPALLKMFDTQREEGRKFYVFIADIVALVAQISILILWPVRDFVVNEKSELTWTIPVSLLLISIGWWENYINKFTAMGKLGARLKEFKRRVRRMRTKIYMIASLWKIILTLILMSVMVTAGSRSCLKVLYGDQDFATDCPHLIHPSGDNVASAEMETNPFYVAVIQVVACLLCYQFSKTACKVMLQVVSFSLPLMLAAPIIGGLFIASCESWYTDSMKAFMPDYLYWTCDINGISRGYLGTLYEDYLLPVALVWWLSFMWVTFHIWMPRVERLVQTEHLFVQPLYCGVMLEQSLMLNRRRDDRDRARRYSDKEQKRKGNTTFSMLDGGFPSQLPATPRDPVRKEPAPMIYVLDDDQCARKNAQKFFDVVDPDFYEFEAHIFFDDAYEPHDVDAEDYNVNSFVHQLVGIVDKAARLEWAMLGGNKMIVHLKDKSKIRIKKRWSQVMYMYYLLGHRLVGQNLDARRKQTLADNTYVLALDGDVDFRPSAVQVLVDRLKRNEKVGAACGRIHPIGMGDWRNIVKINENMSLLYMAYQLLLFCSSLLTPATVFLLITGALNTAFPAFDLINSLVCNAVPMMLAQVLSLVYALLMMVVVVGLGLNMILEGLCSPTAIFLFFLLGVFIISAIMHPQEFTNLLHGALYFLSVPSMSMLLMIYSICNMHVVSWGTRESATATDPNAKAAPQKKPDSKLQALLARFNTSGADDLDSDYGFSFGNLFRCLCCPKPRPDTSEAKFEMVLERLENIERAVTSGNQESQAATGRSIERCMSSDEGVSVTFETINEGEGNEAQQVRVQNDLLELRNKMALMFFMLNGLFIIIVFTLQACMSNITNTADNSV
ncbi:CHS2-like protein [Mya arenaria]|uniref:CHS2-like protein n=1 Tax=Mya arenaria TaxID=6604 RepID=A0ABY7EJ70_MYAAR|nr:CHS2-like protein [Mya arenaria]